MSPLQLLGAAAAALLQRFIEEADGRGRYNLDRLLPEQVAAVCRAVAAHPTLSTTVTICVPEALGRTLDLPEAMLTDKPATHWRHHESTDGRALLLVNNDDLQGASLGNLKPIGSEEMLSEASVWVTCADAGLLPEEEKRWATALKGLRASRSVSLNRFAEYVATTRAAIVEEGLPVNLALGYALPALQLPRDRAYFTGIQDSARYHVNKWRDAYHQLWRKRAPLLLKRQHNDQPIDAADLRDTLDKVREDLDPAVVPVFEAFIAAPPAWCPAVQDFAALDWQQHNSQLLFEQLRRAKAKLGDSTLKHFAAHFPEDLGDEDRAYLQAVDARNVREAEEIDRDFYEMQRWQLAQDPRLKKLWDRFVFGKALDAEDLRSGLLEAVRVLYERLGPTAHGRTLTVECQHHNATQWQATNKYAARYFAQRYKGLPVLFGPRVTWKPASLFDDAATDLSAHHKKKRSRADERTSTAKAANQVKFTVTMQAQGGDEAEKIQLLWHFNPNAISSAFAADWDHLGRHPFAPASVTCETVSAKGRLQSIALRDVQTFVPVGAQKRGALLPHREAVGLDAEVAAALAAGLAESWLSRAAHDAIAAAWARFAEAYPRAVAAYLTHSTAADGLVALAEPYGALLDALATHAHNDKARSRLWRAVAALGFAPVKEGDGAAIVAPWHPLQMVGAAVADRRLGGLVRYLLGTPVVDFGDTRLFFRDMAAELARPFYPEVGVGHHRDRPTLLAATDSFGDYTLLEPAVRLDASDRAAQGETHEDPREAVGVLGDVVRQFLSLYPHEAANLSVVLFNCDAVALPEATVSMLGGLYGDDDERAVRCHVQLRHDDPQKLQNLYESLLEASARDSESAVASEASRDFMARLRVGILAGGRDADRPGDGPSADIVFLQDVVARSSGVHWVNQPEVMRADDPLTHVPAYWSRHRPALRTDTHASTDLCCPMQTDLGWSYLRLMHGLCEERAAEPMPRPLPTRYVRFDQGRARALLDAAHRQGQWVVNYDAILSRQHLRSLGVRVIRHRRAAADARGVIVSSTTPLTMLHTLVRRNLQSLGLDLPPDALAPLAERLVSYASEVSGDIVLRAARRSAFAHELIGVALSRYLLDDELRQAHGEVVCGWYFLDDYAAWLGQREGHLADVLALRVHRDAAGALTLLALVSEAKYISTSILQTQRLHSGRQTEETLVRMQAALFDTPRRLDRDQWLARLADLLGYGEVAAETTREGLQAVQRAVATGQMPVVLRGYSHVFVYQQDPGAEMETARTPLRHGAPGWQETFGPDAVRHLLRAFARDESPRALRARLGPERPWEAQRGQLPASGAPWASTLAGIVLEPPPEAAPEPPPAAAPPKREAVSSRAAARAVGSPPREPEAQGAAGDPFAWATPRVAAVLAASVTEVSATEEEQRWLDQVATQLSSALRGYGLQTRLLDQRLTPNAALLRFQGSANMTKVSVEKQRDVLLTTHALNVLRVAAEPGAIVLSVARPTRQKVSLAAVLRGRRVDDVAARHNTRLVVGVRERDGSTLYLDPAKEHAPHTLIAGTTGSGKSVLLQNLLLDIAMTNTPAMATVTLIDPKQGVDYQGLEVLPHLGGEMVVDQDEAIMRLERLAEEMDDRYRRFREVGKGVNNLHRYNAAVPPAARMPVRWVVHDEFAEWMLVDAYKEAVSKVVQRLGVKARAAGIHLIFAAQRPEDQVMPMQLRSNLDNRLVLRVDGEGTSKIALKEPGAELLLGRGHLAANLQGEGGVTLAQVPMLEPEEMAALIDAIIADAVGG
jgi:S-DNA-T family DNA segregation ATPase FtsK/SpoIIIE